MNSSCFMGTFDQGHSHIPWTIRKSNISLQTTVYFSYFRSQNLDLSRGWMRFYRILKTMRERRSLLKHHISLYYSLAYASLGYCLLLVSEPILFCYGHSIGDLSWGLYPIGKCKSRCCIHSLIISIGWW